MGIEELTDQEIGALQKIVELTIVIEKLQADYKLIREALEFYAYNSRWETGMSFDSGCRARKALKQKELIPSEYFKIATEGSNHGWVKRFNRTLLKYEILKEMNDGSDNNKYIIKGFKICMDTFMEKLEGKK